MRLIHVCLAAFLAVASACTPSSAGGDDDSLPLFECRFVFTNCYPVDPCEDDDFSLHELLVLEGQGLYLETSEPFVTVERLGFGTLSGGGYALPPDLLAGQYHVPGSPHFIVIPIPAGHAFWDYFLAAAAAGGVRWSGSLRYACQKQVTVEQP